MKKSYTWLGTGILMLVAFSCEKNNDFQGAYQPEQAPVFLELPQLRQTDGRISSGYKVFSAEYFTSGGSGRIGRIVYFNDVGNKQLSADFVPDISLDKTNNISFYIDENHPSEDLPVGTTSAAIGRAMRSWDGLKCSALGIHQIDFNPEVKTGLASKLLGYGGSFGYIADIVHAGWMPPSFFDILAPNGSTFILGVTFTIIFTESGKPTDLDRNGKADVAWREIYYNDKFTWADGASIDIETVALHEAGHGLSQAHFGKAFKTTSNGKIHFSPGAVMNAGYTGIQTEINKTDNGGHCSIWSSWPHK